MSTTKITEWDLNGNNILYLQNVKNMDVKDPSQCTNKTTSISLEDINEYKGRVFRLNEKGNIFCLTEYDAYGLIFPSVDAASKKMGGAWYFNPWTKQKLTLTDVSDIMKFLLKNNDIFTPDVTQFLFHNARIKAFLSSKWMAQNGRDSVADFQKLFDIVRKDETEDHDEYEVLTYINAITKKLDDTNPGNVEIVLNESANFDTFKKTKISSLPIADDIYTNDLKKISIWQRIDFVTSNLVNASNPMFVMIVLHSVKLSHPKEFITFVRQNVNKIINTLNRDVLVYNMSLFSDPRKTEDWNFFEQNVNFIKQMFDDFPEILQSVVPKKCDHPEESSPSIFLSLFSLFTLGEIVDWKPCVSEMNNKYMSLGYEWQ